MKPEGLLPCFV